MRVLVTRPEPGASRTAERLAEAGFEPVMMPLTRIVPLAAAVPEAGAFDAVAATSANALRHAPEELLAAIRALPCFAVGSETARMARERGFAATRQGGGDAQALAAAVRQAEPPVGRLLYLCGRVRRPLFEEALAQAGIAVTAVETYDTQPVEHDAEDIRAWIRSRPLDAVLVYSAEAADALAHLFGPPGSASGRPVFVAISQRVAAILARAGLATAIAAEPDEASMLSCLRDISPAGPSISSTPPAHRV